MSLGSALARAMLEELDVPVHDRHGIDQRCHDRSRGYVRWTSTESTATARVEITDGRRFAIYWIRRSLDAAEPLRQQRIHRIYTCAATGDTCEPVEHPDETALAEIRRIVLASPLPLGFRWGDGWACLERERERLDPVRCADATTPRDSFRAGEFGSGER